VLHKRARGLRVLTKEDQHGQGTGSPIQSDQSCLVKSARPFDNEIPSTSGSNLMLGSEEVPQVRKATEIQVPTKLNKDTIISLMGNKRYHKRHYCKKWF
jgi:hypothetical protein